MNKPVILVGCVLLAAVGAATVSSAEVAAFPSNGSGGKPGVFGKETIDVDGKERQFRLIAPKSLDPKKPAPLVFAFHGLGDSKDIMALYSRLDRLAEKHGFVLVYPNGRNRAWPLAVSLAKEDLALFDALYDRIGQQYNIDQRRVYLVGMSNGAYFSHLVASQRSDKVAAICAHSGGLGLLVKEPTVKHKYAVMLVHGDADVIVKVAESRKARDAYTKWGYDVEYLEVKGLNHFWGHRAGVNEKLWTFFEEHPLPER